MDFIQTDLPRYKTILNFKSQTYTLIENYCPLFYSIMEFLGYKVKRDGTKKAIIYEN